MTLTGTGTLGSGRIWTSFRVGSKKDVVMAVLIILVIASIVEGPAREMRSLEILSYPGVLGFELRIISAVCWGVIGCSTGMFVISSGYVFGMEICEVEFDG